MSKKNKTTCRHVVDKAHKYEINYKNTKKNDLITITQLRNV